MDAPVDDSQPRRAGQLGVCVCVCVLVLIPQVLCDLERRIVLLVGTILFADGQVIIATNREDISNMTRNSNKDMGVWK